MGRDAPRLVSVLIPVRNAARLLPDQLNALAAQDYDGPWEVVVADNGSSDGSASVARRLAGRLPSLRVVDASGRRGAGPARNAGAAALQALALGTGGRPPGSPLPARRDPARRAQRGGLPVGRREAAPPRRAVALRAGPLAGAGRPDLWALVRARSVRAQPQRQWSSRSTSSRSSGPGGCRSR